MTSILLDTDNSRDANPAQPDTLEHTDLSSREWIFVYWDGDDKQRSKKSPSFLRAVLDDETVGHDRVVL